MSIDEILKAVRKELGISQELLARDLNVSFSSVNRWEKGRAKPNRIALVSLKDYATKNGISAEVLVALDKMRV
jgi:DNA-binding transcriptional regulator YiaG